MLCSPLAVLFTSIDLCCLIPWQVEKDVKVKRIPSGPVLAKLRFMQSRFYNNYEDVVVSGVIMMSSRCTWPAVSCIHPSSYLSLSLLTLRCCSVLRGWFQPSQHSLYTKDGDNKQPLFITSADDGTKPPVIFTVGCDDNADDDSTTGLIDSPIQQLMERKVGMKTK